jgi:hypothetical protein
MGLLQEGDLSIGTTSIRGAEPGSNDNSRVDQNLQSEFRIDQMGQNVRNDTSTNPSTEQSRPPCPRDKGDNL